MEDKLLKESINVVVLFIVNENDYRDTKITITHIRENTYEWRKIIRILASKRINSEHPNYMGGTILEQKLVFESTGKTLEEISNDFLKAKELIQPKNEFIPRIISPL